MKIFIYHGIHPKDLPLEEFQKQLAFIAHHYQVIPLTEVLNGPFNKNLAALTFDDGLENNYTTAYPILQAMKLPATFFVCPSLVERRWIWNHEVRARFYALPILAQQNFLNKYDAPSIELLVWFMKNLGVRVRNIIHQDLVQRQPSFTPSEDQVKRYSLMDWNQLRSLDRNLITIGAHTLNHSTLTKVESALDHIYLSKSQLQDSLDREIECFAYPEGIYDSSTVSLVQKCRFKLAVTSNRNEFEPFTAPEPFTLPRVRLPWIGV